MSDDKNLIPLDIRADIEVAVAEAFNQSDLRAALESRQLDLGVLPPDQDEVDLVVMWVWASRQSEWPRLWRESDTFGPYINGCIVAAIEALDLANSRSPADRQLKEYQRDWLDTWELQVSHENR